MGSLQWATDLALQRDRSLPAWSALPPPPELVEPALCVVAEVVLAVAAQPQVAFGAQVRHRRGRGEDAGDETAATVEDDPRLSAIEPHAGVIRLEREVHAAERGEIAFELP